MDVVLDVFDTYLFDRIYANVLPIRSGDVSSSFDPVSTLAAGLKSYYANNATAFTQPAAPSTWRYEPASALLPMQPSEFAYMSRWDRDNVWRQTISLYAIAW